MEVELPRKPRTPPDDATRRFKQIGHYAPPSGSHFIYRARDAFWDQVIQWRPGCHDDLLVRCQNKPGAVVSETIEPWKNAWHLWSVDPLNDWISATASQTITIQEVFRGFPNSDIPKKFFMPSFSAGGPDGYPLKDCFPMFWDPAVESEADAKARLQRQFHTWLNAFLTKAKVEAVKTGADREPTTYSSSIPLDING